MASRDNIMGMFAYLMILLFMPWVTYVVLDASQGTLVAALATVAIVLVLAAIAFFGVRHRGMAFFGLVGEFLSQLVDGEESGKKTASKGAKVPRPPTYWTNKLIVAVGDRCEVPGCAKRRHLEVHHIKNHAQGGTNSLSNLLVLCRDHHAACQPGGGYSIGRQKEWVRRNKRFIDKEFSRKWKRSVLDKEREKQAEAEGLVAGW